MPQVARLQHLEAGQDYRAEKMDSVEGKGVARQRRDAWIDAHDPEDLAAAYPALPGDGEVPAEMLDEVAAWALERADLIGFWVAWHSAGGFRALEAGGWHRATIYRRVRRFRAVFGAHPDEYRFGWLRVEPRRLWDRQLADRLAAATAPNPDPEG
ncbi:MAG TPA: hypothetical protein VFP54_11030 [Acidimicrobiales bacterium]|nr:hypothetical protein [Acidimicrobiales bacterium]